MAEKIRVGVIGTSGWTAWEHLPPLRQHPQAEIAAICGRNLLRAKEVASEFEIQTVYTDYQHMIDQGGLDAVLVSTPDDQHFPMVMYTLDAGLHVLCEKPIALNSEQARTMYEKAQSVGVKHMVYFTYRWLPHFQRVLNLVREGYVGRCFQCSFNFLMGVGLDRGYSWRSDRAHSNGILADLGSHMLDLARLYVGEVSAVSAQATSFIERKREDGAHFEPNNDAAVMRLEFDNGTQGNIEVSWVTSLGDRAAQQQVRLWGENGSIEVDVYFGGELAGGHIRGIRRGEDQWSNLEAEEMWSGIDHNLSVFDQNSQFFQKESVGGRLFIDAIIENRPISPTFYDGMRVQEVIDAAIESSQTRQTVSIRRLE